MNKFAVLLVVFLSGCMAQGPMQQLPGRDVATICASINAALETLKAANQQGRLSGEGRETVRSVVQLTLPICKECDSPYGCPPSEVATINFLEAEYAKLHARALQVTAERNQ